MNKTMKRILIGLGSVVASVLLVVGGIIGYAYVNVYRPQPIEDAQIIYGNESQIIQTQMPYAITTWNIGYGGLGKDQDFFMDNGKNSGALNLAEVEENMQKISDFVAMKNSDFYFFQEIDESGKRSYDVNQLDLFSNQEYSMVFGKNYDVKFVPVPLLNPMGGAVSGITTLSKAKPQQAQRFTFDGEEPFFKQLFDLQRCFTITRYETANGKELVLINAHFSAFDEGAFIREQQLAQMKQVLIEEQKQGNYIILGGDFNHELPGTSSDNFSWEDVYPEWCFILPDTFTPDHFTWAVDGRSPSVRSANMPYTTGQNFVATVDGFLVSDNIQIEFVETFGELDFENSDHNPVELQFSLL